MQFFVAVGRRDAPVSFPPSGPNAAEVVVPRWHQSVRLRKSRDFQRVQRGGRKIRHPHLFVLYLPGETACSRFGLTVSRKVGNAVHRNRVKRWIREILREEREDLAGSWDVVVIARRSASTAGLSTLRAELTRALKRVGDSER